MVATIREALVITLAAISMMANASQECIVLSNGSEISFAHYRDGNLLIDSTLLIESKVINPVWPSYSKSIESLFFEAHENGVSGIYRANAYDTFNNIELLMRGRYPALSPKGNKIAYFNENNILAIKEILTGNDILIGEQYEKLSIWKRPLWLSNNKLIYVTKNDDIFVYNQSKDLHSKLFSEKLYPITSSDGVVLFIDHEAKGLYEYKSGELRLVFNNRFLSIGPGIILLKGGLLYSRQTWREVLRLSEAKATFYFSHEDSSEKELISDLSLFGGSLLPCDIGKK